MAGDVRLVKEEYQKLGIVSAISCKKDNMSLDYAITNSRQLLGIATQEFMQNYLLKEKSIIANKN